jgi:hypothetical protein
MRDIQQKLLREIDDLGEEEARRRQRERVVNNPILTIPASEVGWRDYG